MMDAALMAVKSNKGGSMKTYQVTKQFTSGILAGMSITETTTVRMAVGHKVSRKGTSGYTVTSCVEVA